MTSTIPEDKKVAYNFLGGSGLKVSNIAMGCATFGEAWGWPGQSDEDAAHQILNRYAEWGGNFVDTANIYAFGKSETIIGKYLERGLLSGKVKRGVRPTEGRLAAVAQKPAISSEAGPHWSSFGDKNFDIVDVLRTIAEKKGRSTPQVALRWLLQKDVVSSVIIGARTISQLDDNMGAGNGWSLTKEEEPKGRQTGRKKYFVEVGGVKLKSTDITCCYKPGQYVRPLNIFFHL